LPNWLSFSSNDVIKVQYSYSDYELDN
jgi:hypothetical protein